MGLESGTYVQDLVATNPTSSDGVSQGDDHFRLIKQVLKNTFPDGNRPYYRAKAATITTDTSPLPAADGTFFDVDTSLGAVNISLPTLTSEQAGWQITVQKTTSDDNPLTVTPSTGAINGEDAAIITSQYTALRAIWSGTNWRAYAAFGRLSETLDPIVQMQRLIIPAGVGWFDGAPAVPSSEFIYAFGQAISRSVYAKLFERYGTTHGTGNGTTTFNVPDVRGYVIAGRDDMGGVSADRLTSPLNGDILGAKGGSQNHVLTLGQMAKHRHFLIRQQQGSQNSDGTSPTEAIRDTFTSGSPRDYTLQRTENANEANAGLSSQAGNDEPHNNVQPTIILNFILKAH